MSFEDIMKKRFFLADCNNFYVSCERVFNPTLYKKPVVVLGSNDACVIARSNEAKVLDIAMGVPAFECEKLFKKHNVIVYSANFALYGDMSDRVMKTLMQFASDLELYSVDESFFFVPSHFGSRNFKQPNYYTNYAHTIRTHVKKRTGIPISIGIGPTKTLAKIANKIAKKNNSGVFDITDQNHDEYLEKIEVADIWGVGYRYAKLLRANRILTAKDFKYMDEKWVRKKMTVVGHRTLLELRGQACIPLMENPEPRQSLCVSRLFGKKVRTLTALKEALASYTAIAAEKLRIQNSLVGHITVFAVTNRYHDPENYYFSMNASLTVPTSYTPDIITAANQCLETLYNCEFAYKKVGIVFTDIIPAEFMQLNAFVEQPDTSAQSDLMTMIDKVNSKWGRNKIKFAAEGVEQKWKMYQANKSQCFTTNWHELLTINI